MRFIVTFCTWREEGAEEDADEFNEAFLGFLLNLHTAKDKGIRFRACQIIAGVLNGLGADAEVSDELYERMTDVMLERIRDKMPPVRAQAAQRNFGVVIDYTSAPRIRLGAPRPQPPPLPRTRTGYLGRPPARSVLMSPETLSARRPGH